MYTYIKPRISAKFTVHSTVYSRQPLSKINIVLRIQLFETIWYIRCFKIERPDGRTKCNFLITDRDFVIKISGFKDEKFCNLWNWQRSYKFPYLNILCYFRNICRWTLTVISFNICYRENSVRKTQMIMTSSIPYKAKVNAKRYSKTLLLRVIEECKSLLPSGFILHLGGAPAHTGKLAQDCIARNCRWMATKLAGR